jgi:hypothetical protein
MEKEIRVAMSLDELRQLLQTPLAMQPGAARPIGPFVTVDDRLKERWPLVPKKSKRRISDVAIARYREHVGRYPHKMTGYENGTYMIEVEHIEIVDRVIDLIRNEEEARRLMPLFTRRDR